MLSDDRRQVRDSASEYSASCIDIVPALTAVQQSKTCQVRLLLDQLTKSHIHAHLSHWFAVYGDGAEALPVEPAMRAMFARRRPYLNPL